MQKIVSLSIFSSNLTNEFENELLFQIQFPQVQLERVVSIHRDIHSALHNEFSNKSLIIRMGALIDFFRSRVSQINMRLTRSQI